MAKIYASTSSVINCVYTLSIARDSNNNSNIVITASGTIYGNGSSQNSSSDLYAHLCYNVSPANTTGTGAPTSRGTRFGDGQEIVHRPLNKTSIPESGKAFSVSWTVTNNAAKTFSNCALFLSGSATDQGLAGGAESYMFIGEKLTNISNQVRYYTQTLSIAAGYTSVSNPLPNSIKFNNSTTSPLIVAPNGSITVSWDAGSAGTNNPIKEYEVVLNNITKTTTSTSYTFPNPNLTRGNVYTATVKAIPKISGYGPSQGAQSSRQIKGNNLPHDPTVTIAQGTATVDNKIYRLKNGTTTTIRFNLSDGDTGNTDGQSISYRYATSSLTPTTSNTTVVTNSTDFTPTSTTTYYFWSFDGLEFSGNSVTKTINIGTDISVDTSMSFTPGTSYSNNGTSYYTAGTHTVTTTGDVGNKTYKWYLEYNTTASATGATTILLGTTNTDSYSWTYPRDGGWGKRYRIYCVVTDALGSSGTAYGYDSETTWFTIPAEPTFEQYIYNKWENNTASKINHSYQNDFYETIVAKGVIDNSINKISYKTEESIEVREQDGVANLVTLYKQNGYIPLKILQANTEKNTSYNLKITMEAAWGGSFEVKYKITRNGYPRISDNALYNKNNIDAADPAIIKPFSEDSDYNFVFPKPDKFSNNNFYTDSNDLESKISLFLFKGDDAIPVLNQKSWTIDSTSGYITAPATRGGNTATAGLYNWNTNALELNLNGPNVVGLRIKFTDVFGQTYSIDKPDYLTIDFTETPTINLSISNNSGSSTSRSVVKEGNIITYEVTGDIYNTTSTTINAYIYENITQTEPTKTTEGWKKIGTKTFTPSKTKSNNKETYSQSITYTLGEISQSNYLYFRADIVQNTSKNETDVNDTYYISQRHTNISNFSVKLDYSNKVLKYTTTLSDQGAGRIDQASSGAGLTSAKYGLQFSTNENFSNKQWLQIANNNFTLINSEAWLDTNIAVTYTQSHDFTFPSGIDFYYVRPVYKTTIGSVSYTSEGDSTIFYDLMPTVSYRKNQIGINIDNTESYSDSVVVIGPATEKNLVKLYSANNTATIDLDSGRLTGFKIDGNSIYPANFDTSSITDLTAGNLIVNGAISLVNPLSVGSGGTGASTATANTMFAGPASGSTSAPSFRALVAADIPNLAASKITSGTLAIAQGGTGAATAAINTVFAGPSSGSTAAPSFRALVAADIPNLNASKITAGTLAVAQGGTGSSSLDGAGIVTKTGDQTINGIKTFTSYLMIDKSSTALGLNDVSTMLAFKYKNPDNKVKTVDVIRTMGDSETGANNGIAIVGSSSGNTIISSGEAAPTVVAGENITNSESTYIIADNTINFWSNANTYGSDSTTLKKAVTIDTTGRTKFLSYGATGFYARNISYGTDDPSGGSNGDIYIKYTT